MVLEPLFKGSDLLCARIRVRKLRLDFFLRHGRSVELGVRINQVVERRAILRRLQHKIAAYRESDARRVEMPEIVVVPVRMLRRLGRIDRNPHAARVELGPAVVAGDIAGLRRSDRKANRKPRRDSARAQGR